MDSELKTKSGALPESNQQIYRPVVSIYGSSSSTAWFSLTATRLNYRITLILIFFWLMGDIQKICSCVHPCFRHDKCPIMKSLGWGLHHYKVTATKVGILDWDHRNRPEMRSLSVRAILSYRLLVLGLQAITRYEEEKKYIIMILFILILLSNNT